MATFRLGSADTPLIPYAEGVYGLRYVEQVITDHLSFGTSAEWGFHVLGSNPLWGYQVTVGTARATATRRAPRASTSRAASPSRRSRV